MIRHDFAASSGKSGSQSACKVGLIGVFAFDR